MCYNVQLPQNTFIITLLWVLYKRTTYHLINPYQCVCLCMYTRHKYSLILEFYTLSHIIMCCYTSKDFLKNTQKICIMMIILIILARACMGFTSSCHCFSSFLYRILCYKHCKGKCVYKFTFFKE